MASIQRVLVPTDFTDLALHALAYARELTDSLHAQLHLLHVEPLALNLALPAEMGSGFDLHAILPVESAQTIVNRVTDRLRDYVHEHVIEPVQEPVVAVRVGIDWQEITRYAAEESIDLIVIGSHARSMLKRVLLGSVSKAVLEHAHCPVLMVPISAVEREAPTEQ